MLEKRAEADVVLLVLQKISQCLCSDLQKCVFIGVCMCYDDWLPKHGVTLGLTLALIP